MPSSRTFQLPKDGPIYTTKIIQRCEDLISHGIWTGIESIRLRKWLSNFKNETEEYFAACILDSLIYRSEAQTISLLKQLFLRTLPDLNRTHPIPTNTGIDWMESTNKHRTPFVDPRIRFVIAVGQSDPPTKSAYIIARYMKRHLYVRDMLIIKPWEIETCINSFGIRTFLFIDDFLGTGTQFCELIEGEDIERLLPDIYAAYIPLAAHEKGVSTINQRFNSLIKVNPVERLDKSHCLFNDECCSFQDGVNSPESGKEFYYELLRNRGIDIDGADRRGFGHLELTYVFQHAAPDNCVPILWWNRNPSVWHPLFDR